MKYEKYDLSISTDGELFRFTSSGIKGDIEKLIQFEQTGDNSVYNLGFGDKRIEERNGALTETIDYEADSENGDRDKVLATVAISVYEYTTKYPGRWIIFSGSDERRTRLYRMALTKNYVELNKDFHIFGVLEIDGKAQRVPFDSHTKFLAYIVKRK